MWQQLAGGSRLVAVVKDRAAAEEASRTRAAAVETLASGLFMTARTAVPSPARFVDIGSLPRSAGSLSGVLGNLPSKGAARERVVGWTTPEEQRLSAAVSMEPAPWNVASSLVSKRDPSSGRVKHERKLQRKKSRYRGVSWYVQSLFLCKSMPANVMTGAFDAQA
jgi:hypothetical protein